MRLRAFWFLAAAFTAQMRADQPKRAQAVIIPRQAQSQVQNLRVFPGGVTIVSTDPDAPPPPQPVSIRWNGLPGPDPGPWNLTIRAVSTAVSNCPAIPIASVTVTCNSATVSGGGGAAMCSPASTLSTHPVPVAAGLQGRGNRDYAVDVTLSFADAWRYPAATSPQCLLSLNYTVDFY